MIRFSTFADGSGHVLKIGTRISLYFINEWSQVLRIGRCNWYNLTLVDCAFEIDELSEIDEFKLVVLGLGFHLHYNRGFEHSTMKRIGDAAYFRYIKDAEIEEGAPTRLKPQAWLPDDDDKETL